MSVYPPPTNEEPLSIFNPLDYIFPTDAITREFADKNYLKFPIAQGTENLFDTNVTGTLDVTGNIVINTVGNGITFPDNTRQTTASALSPLSPNPAGTYTNSTVTINAFGQVTNASSGVNTLSYTYISSNSSTTSWNFKLNDATTSGYTGEGVKLGKVFDYYVYTTSGTGANKETGYFFNVGNGSLNIATPSQFGVEQRNVTGAVVVEATTNNFIARGSGMFLPTVTQQSVLSYWQGFQETYTFTQYIYSYYMDIINTLGNTLSMTNSNHLMSITTPTFEAPFINTNAYNGLNITATTPLLNTTTLTLVIVPRP
jgi:hypothetical protein